MAGRSFLAGAAGGLIGAMVGALATAAMLSRETRSAATSTDAAELRDALTSLAAELRASRGGDDRSAGGRGPAPSGASRDPEPPPAPTRIVASGVEAAHAPAAELRPAGSRWTPEPRLERLRDLRGFMDDQSVRQRWLFTGQGEALAWFGTPTLVWGGNGEERWEYNLPTGVFEDGDEIRVTWTLVFVHGRLAQVFGGD